MQPHDSGIVARALIGAILENIADTLAQGGLLMREDRQPQEPVFYSRDAFGLIPKLCKNLLIFAQPSPVGA